MKKILILTILTFFVLSFASADLYSYADKSFIFMIASVVISFTFIAVAVLGNSLAVGIGASFFSILAGIFWITADSGAWINSTLQIGVGIILLLISVITLFYIFYDIYKMREAY